MSKFSVNRLQDIFDEIEAIEQFIAGMTSEEFKGDKKTIYAVTRAIEIIGEAANNVPKEVKDKYPSIPWSQIKGMRNKSIHEYWSVDADILWKTVQISIPQLKQDLLSMDELDAIEYPTEEDN